MRFASTSPRRATLSIVCWWLLSITLMCLNAYRDRGATGQPGDLPNWHNRSGDLPFFLGLMSAELAVLLAVLRPWSYHHSWGRALSAALLITPWLFLGVVVLIHSGGIMVAHVLWLAVTWVALLATTVVSVVRSTAVGRNAT